MSGSQFRSPTEWIWVDGRFVPWNEANIHVMSHAVHYGSAVFEGVRSYVTPEGPSFFRLRDHMRRFKASAKIHRMPLGWDIPELEAASRELLDRNGLTSCYLRPLAMRGVGAAGLDPSASPVRVFLIAWPWDAYLGADSLQQGVACCISSWMRPAPNTHPTVAKAAGNYINASLMKMEAKANGFDEAIALSVDGTVSEGSGQNVFLVQNGEIRTPAVDGSFLQGITRDSVLRIAEDLAIPVKEGCVPRESLYIADEVFLTGTASEVVPVRSVDRVQVGQGGIGPVTARIQERFLAITRGEVPDIHGWLSPALPRPAEVA